MADLGFPVGGDANPPGDGGGAPTYDFAKFCEKLHEIEKIVGHGGRSPGVPPLNPPLTPMDTVSFQLAVADPGGGAEGAMVPPGPVEIGHKKDGRQRWLHRFHVSRPPLTRPLDPLLVGSVYVSNESLHLLEIGR